MTDIEKSYLAGIIDGEGTITLSRQRKDGYRTPSITFCNNDKSIIDYVQTFCHGSLAVKNPRQENWKINYCWAQSRQIAL